MKNIKWAIALLTPSVVLLAGASLPGYGADAFSREGAIAQVDECNALITAANAAVTDVQQVAQSNTGNGDVQSLVLVADAADRAVGRMQGITLTNPQLQGYQARFVELYGITGQASRTLVAAVEQDDIAGAREAYATILRTTSQEGPLVSEINAYCSTQS